MPFEYEPEKERKHPREYGGSPAKALLEEIRSFTKQHRKHSLRRFAGEDQDLEPEAPMQAKPEECPACAKGECDDPEHLNEEDRGAMAKMLARDGGDHDYEE